MSIVPLPDEILSFRDALGLAFELSDEFAFAYAVVVTDRRRRSIDFHIERRVGHNITSVLGWLSQRFAHYPAKPCVVLISVRSVDPLSVFESDLADYRFARWTVQRLGADLLDWIETDGELVRSYSYLVNPTTAWAAGAVAEGTIDGSDW